MKKISIKNKATGEITHGSDLDESEFQKWIDYHVENNSWGKKAFKETVKYEVQDEQGNIVEPAEYVEHEAEYEIIIEDISAQVTKDLEISQRKMVREECLKIVDEIAAYNVQVAQNLQGIFSSSGFIQIILALNTGAAKSAATGMRALGPQVYPQQLVEEFAAKLEAL